MILFLDTNILIVLNHIFRIFLAIEYESVKVSL